MKIWGPFSSIFCSFKTSRPNSNIKTLQEHIIIHSLFIVLIVSLGFFYDICTPFFRFGLTLASPCFGEKKAGREGQFSEEDETGTRSHRAGEGLPQVFFLFGEEGRSMTKSLFFWLQKACFFFRLWLQRLLVFGAFGFKELFVLDGFWLQFQWLLGEFNAAEAGVLKNQIMFVLAALGFHFTSFCNHSWPFKAPFWVGELMLEIAKAVAKAERDNSKVEKLQTIFKVENYHEKPAKQQNIPKISGDSSVSSVPPELPNFPPASSHEGLWLPTGVRATGAEEKVWLVGARRFTRDVGTSAGLEVIRTILGLKRYYY